jgi:putative tryptophan/tyrosine transport system substrate-binding protein
MLDRRAFLAAAAVLFAASAGRAQQRLPRVAVVATGVASLDLSENGHPEFSALLLELRRLGYVEGRTIAFERWGAAGLAETEYSRLGQRVAETRPDLIFATGSRLILAVKNATTEIPVVFIGATPVEFGLVAGLARPGANLTGFASDAGTETGTKRLQLVIEAKPGVRRVVWLGTPMLWAAPYTEPVRMAAKTLNITLVPALVEGPVSEASIGRALAAFAGQSDLALFVPLAIDFSVQARPIAEIALANGWPGIGEIRDFAESGLLLSYGPDRRELMRSAAGYIDRVLKGARPADLPVQQPARFEFLVNLRTARAMGFDLPTPYLALATEYIE